jgi:hypothetical protein
MPRATEPRATKRGMSAAGRNTLGVSACGWRMKRKGRAGGRRRMMWEGNDIVEL